MTTGLLIAGTACAWLFVATFLIDGATRPGYRPVYHPVSALALGRRGWIQTTNFIVCGTAVIGASIGVHGATGSDLLTAAIAVFGAGLVASGVFPMDPMRGYPPGTPEGDPPEFSRRHQRHDAAGALVFLSLPVAAVIAAFVLDPWPWKVASALVAVTVAALFIRFASAWEADADQAGLLQRLSMVPGWVWLGALFLHLAG